MNDNLGAANQFQTQIAAAGNISSQSPYSPGTRMIYEGGQWKPYTGSGLVTRDGKVLRTPVDPRAQYYASRIESQSGQTSRVLGPSVGQVGSTFYYDLDRDPRVFYSQDPAKRNVMLNRLVQGGFLDERSRGNFSSELAAITEWLDYANTLGLEAEFALDEAITGGRGKMGGGGGQPRTYRTTATEDLIRLSKRVAQDIIGRELTNEEAARFAQTYQQQEVAYQKALYSGGTVQEPVSLEMAAQTFAEQAAPQEAAGYGYLNYTNKLFQLIGVG